MSQLITLDLTEELGEGQYVQIRHPKLLPWGVQKRITSVIKDPKNPTTEELSTFSELLAVTLIKQGNVDDIDGTPIEFPLTEQTVNNVPGPVIEAVTAKYAELRKASKGGEDLPNE